MSGPLSTLAATAQSAILGGDPQAFADEHAALLGITSLYSNYSDQWRNLANTLPVGTWACLSMIGPRASALADCSVSLSGEFTTVDVTGMDPSAFFGAVSGIVGWCVREVIAERLDLSTLGQAVGAMSGSGFALWRPTYNGDQLPRAAFYSYLRDTGFQQVFTNALMAFRGQLDTESANAAALDSLIGSVHHAVSWVAMTRPWEILADKIASLHESLNAAHSDLATAQATLAKLGNAASPQDVAMVRDLTNQIYAQEQKAHSLLSPIGMWEGPAPSGLRGLGSLAIFGSVAGTVVLAIAGAITLIIAALVALQMQANNEAATLQTTLVSTAKNLLDQGKITPAQYNGMVATANQQANDIATRRGAGAAGQGFQQAAGGIAMVVVAVGLAFLAWGYSKRGSFGSKAAHA